MTKVAANDLVTLLRLRAQAAPDRRAYTFLTDGEAEGETFTYGELDRRARAVAERLRAVVEPGGRVLLLYQPGLEYVAAFFGCLYAAAVAVPAYPPRRNRNQLRLRALAADSGAKAALTTAGSLSRLAALAAGDESLARLKWLTTDDIPDGEAEGWRDPCVKEDDLAFLQYTSGSTSAPKGVMISHRNLLSNERLIQHAFRQSEESVVVGWLPLYHDMGLIGNVIQPLYVGAPCVLMSPLSFLQRPLRWLRAVSRYRATTSGGPNFAYDLCAKKVGDDELAALDLSGWEVAFNGAEPVRSATLERFAERFAPCGFRRDAFSPCYGLAEATLVVTASPESRPPLVKQVSKRALGANRVEEPEGDDDAQSLVGSGRALPGERVVVADPAGLQECAPGEVGEIWVSGASVGAGYWGDERRTAETFGARLADTGEGPFLRTGDLGFLDGGELFVTGRLKDLIIIRGLNHYPQDIELSAERSHAALRPGCGAAFSVTLDGEERLVVVHELEPRREAEAAQAIDAVRDTVVEEFEVQPHAVALVRAGSVPKTSSGKIQRAACRGLFLEGGLEVLAEWRATPAAEGAGATWLTQAGEASGDGSLEDWLRLRIAETLRIDPAAVDVNRPVLRYGLDSLLAVELSHRAETELGLSLPLGALLGNQTIAQLAAQLNPQQGEAGVRASSRGAAVEYPLSHGQQALWFLHQLAPDNTAYHISRAVFISSEVDAGALRRALQALVDRHPALRTSFVSRDGEPAQIVREGVEVSFAEEDASALDEEALRARLDEEAHRPFDLGEVSLLRARLFHARAGRRVLLLNVHHIVADLWSLVVMLHELGALYTSELEGSAPPPPPAQTYEDFVRWQAEMLESEEGRRQRDFWRERLGGELPTLDLPTDHPRPAVQTYAGASLSFKLDAALVSRLKAFSRERGVTLYTTLLAAFQLLLARYAGQDEVIVGSPAAGRRRAEFAGLVGYLVNFVPLRTDCDAGATFDELLGRVRATALAAFEHQDYPLSLLAKHVRAGGDHGRSPLFRAAFVWQKAHLLGDADWAGFALGESGARMRLGGLDIESLALERRETQFDLMLLMAESGDAVAASFEYSTELFEAATIERMAGHLATLLASAVADPARRVSELELLRDEERRGLLHDCNPPATRTRGDCLHELFEAQAARTPGAVALVGAGRRLTYAELDARAEALARRLRVLGVGPESLVGVLLSRTPGLVAALLGVLKAGAAYVPLDPAYPRERVEYMLSDSGARVLVTQRDLLGAVEARGAEVVCVEEVEAEDSGGGPVIAGARPENLAYVIYTSGSTGRPKGVAITHGNAAALLRWAREFFTADELSCVLASTSVCFDLSIYELFVPLAWGGRVVLVEDALRLPEVVEPVTLVNTVPSAMEALLREGTLPRSVLVVNLAGEALRPELAARVYERGAGVRRVVNLYGPTEDTTYSTGVEVPRGVERVTIGIPVAGSRAYVLDARMQPVPVGVAGEVYLGGESLSRGYLNRPALTAERFVPDPHGGEPGARLYRTGDAARRLADGELDYLGRLDQQVKVRGYRIEPGEIEAALLRHPSVREAAVVAAGVGEGGGSRLVAFVVAREGAELPGAGGWREHLRERLPDYMMPSIYVKAEELPLTTNGKVNRRALASTAAEAEAATDGESVEPRGAVEEVIAEAWRQVLGVKQVGAHDNFFDLGGDSILSIQIVSRLNQAGLRLSPQQLFQHPTVAELAEALGRAPEAVSAEQGPVTGPLPLTPVQRWFFAQQFEDAHHWNQAVMLEARAALDAAALEMAFAHLLSHHDALRLRFLREDGDWRQFNAEPGGDAPFTRVDLGGLDAAERRRVVESAARQWQSSLNLSEGPLARAVYFDSGPSEPDRLLLIAHHLVVDAVSWRILLEDFEMAYRQASEGGEVRLAPKTTSFKQWAERLADYARSDDARREADYWLSEERLGAEPLSPDPALRPGGEAPESANSEGDARTLRVELSPEETQTLLHAAPQTLRAQVNEVLLAALALALPRRGGARSVLVDVEGHGREPVFDGVDVSRTVGWFTTIYPVLLEAAHDGADEAEVLKVVKERLRAVPRRGVGHGVLLHMGGDAEVARTLGEGPRAGILFNYLGRFDRAMPEGSLFALSEEPCGPVRSPRARRSHLLEVNSYVAGGRLVAEWAYGGRVHRRGAIERLAESFMESLRSLVARCHTADAAATPSDFPLAQLSQEQLDEALAEVTFDD